MKHTGAIRAGLIVRSWSAGERLRQTGAGRSPSRPVWRRRIGTYRRADEDQSARLFDDEDLDAIPQFEPTPAPPTGYARLLYGRSPVHTFSRTMNNLWLNNEIPENKLWLNDQVAKKLGITMDEEVILENQDGKRSNPIKVLVTPGIRPDAVYMAHGFGSKSPLLTRAYGKGAADGFLITETVQDPFLGATSKRTNFIRIVKGGRVLDIPELIPVPAELPQFALKNA